MWKSNTSVTRSCLIPEANELLRVLTFQATRLATRGAQAAVALLVLTLVVFVMSRATGDPLDLMLPPTATQEQFRYMQQYLELDKPIVVQYATYVGNIVSGDLGTSIRSGEPVIRIVSRRMMTSLELAVSAGAMAFLVGIPLGVVAAVRRGTVLDSAARVVALVGQAVPAFWAGILFIQVFAVGLGWFPTGGRESGLRSLILPTITLSLYGIAGVSRLLRSSMLDTLTSDFVQFARAKGMPETVVILKHCLWNALLPVISFAGLLFINLITLSIIVEVIFSWPGIGAAIYTAVVTRDFPLIQGLTLVAGGIAIVISMIVDVVYTFVDPRIRVVGQEA